MNFLEIFQYSFFTRALISGIFLAALLAILGIFVVIRRMSFFSDGVAHASLAGIALAVIFSLNPLLIAIISAVIFSLFIYFLEKKTNLSSDALIGLIFTTGMALGVVLISLKAGYQPDLMSFLFGNILAITQLDSQIMIIVSLLLLTLLIFIKNDLLLASLDRVGAYLKEIKISRLEIAFYVVLAVAIILGIKMLGIILVSALLLIPPSSAKLLSRSFKGFFWKSLLISELTIIFGLFFSFYFNWPTGATIVLTGAVIFFLILLLNKIGFSSKFK
ncbi:manganese transporter [Candidatus Jorgensenbacteria bacterium CG_4_10_14_0_8_um_filter_39_13]|uniref:Manganese transporter n=2 Tax=Candidatus Joergenseniibacteriota TaxID=1752739 RepID=A0A2M7RHH0_9BACT|nr:MAG: manganese transporter [Candidatus Jorgensenbacteria bacterium CG11_big_fil_rev_8_21_14_0_20_38_23]PIV13069.1 MAG: manganese transporter [Candidatus Jorgensenbacteria bacterium CG03_land_8_20_14_0_80_38_39]PIW97900.1 MAG: manganese transporter [Candidatus Jorgensenbacteria bacterium CG_4_8_14_3_um_filter_38_10]PIY96215.1 MAG: manganese transporter [Candidatus Jorgensenbacteria bacterium CG_4_10_14_0_8_um_filter_39_13]PJA95142.1 MAG: manganese transporter [Candidatus Jorgensenbacteria bac